MSLRSALLVLCAFLAACVVGAAEDEQFVLKKPASVGAAATGATPATVLAGAHGYAYVGCWNETVGYRSLRRNGGGERAVRGGKNVAKDTMTASDCLAYCALRYNGQIMQYAGLQNGRECFCGSTLSPLTEKLNETTRCTHVCSGNTSEICGGQLALTLYNLTSLTSKTGIAWSQFSGAAGYGTLAFITFVIAAIV